MKRTRVAVVRSDFSSLLPSSLPFFFFRTFALYPEFVGLFEKSVGPGYLFPGAVVLGVETASCDGLPQLTLSYFSSPNSYSSVSRC